MLREIQPWLVVGLTYISFIDYFCPKYAGREIRHWSLLVGRPLGTKITSIS
jgi:hypothetical protein